MLTTPLSQFSPAADLQADDTPPREQWQLQELKHKHVECCALLAQGLANKKVAALLQWTPEYITMLLRQPLIKDKIKEYAEAADARLVALTEQSVEVIAEVLREGNHKEKLNAARLQMEATNRVGAGARGNIVVNQKFVVHVPPKALSAGAWVAAHTLQQDAAVPLGFVPDNVIDVTPEPEHAGSK